MCMSCPTPAIHDTMRRDTIYAIPTYMIKLTLPHMFDVRAPRHVHNVTIQSTFDIRHSPTMRDQLDTRRLIWCIVIHDMLLGDAINPPYDQRRQSKRFPRSWETDQRCTPHDSPGALQVTSLVHVRYVSAPHPHSWPPLT